MMDRTAFLSLGPGQDNIKLSGHYNCPLDNIKNRTLLSLGPVLSTFLSLGPVLSRFFYVLGQVDTWTGGQTTIKQQRLKIMFLVWWILKKRTGQRYKKTSGQPPVPYPRAFIPCSPCVFRSRLASCLTVYILSVLNLDSATFLFRTLDNISDQS